MLSFILSILAASVCLFSSTTEAGKGYKIPYRSFAIEVQNFWVNSSITPYSLSVAFQPAARSAAMFSISAHDAVNSIIPRYQTYMGVVPNANPTANLIAAIVGSFKTIQDDLSATVLDPNGAPYLTEAQKLERNQYIATRVNKWLSDIDDKPSRINEGYAIGVVAAQRMIANRTTDNWDNTPTYPNPDVWVPGTTFSWDGRHYAELTGRVAINMTCAQYANLRPFAARSLELYMPPPPPPMNSSIYIDSILLTKLIGGKTSTVRTSAMVEDALYWKVN